MNAAYTEYIKKPRWIKYDNLLKSSTGFSRFIDQSNLTLNKEYIELDLLRKYYVSDRQSAINLIDELALRGFKFVSQKSSSILPDKTNCSTQDILYIPSNGCKYINIDFKNLGLGDFNKRFDVKCDLFFNGISLNSFFYFNKSINKLLLQQEFINNGFEVVDEAINIKSEIKPQISNEDLLISEIFKEGIFNNFNKYCYDNNLMWLKDMKNLNIDELASLKGFGIGRINSIKERYTKYSSSYRNKQNQIISIDIPASIEGILLKDIFYENKFSIFRIYCTDNDLITIKDLSSFNFNLLSKVDGIGVGKIKAIKEKYLSILSNTDISFISENDVLEEEGIKTIIHKDFCEIRIGYVYEDNIVDYMVSTGINTIDGLSKFDPNHFRKISGVGKKKADQLTEELNLLSLPIEDYTRAKFDKITTLDEFDVYRERVLNKVTLEKIGSKLNLTRERIRQKEKKASTLIFKVLVLLEEALFRKGYFTNSKIFQFDLLVEILGSYENAFIARDCIINNELNHIKYFEELDEFFIDTNIVDVRNKLIQILNGFGDIFNFYNEIVYIEEQLQKNNIDFIDVFTLQNFIKACGYKKYKDYYSNKNISRELACQIALKEHFPLGWENTLEEIKKMQQIIFVEYGFELSDNTNTRNTWMLLERGDTSAILWGKSTKMHIDNVVISDRLLTKVKGLIDAALENSASVSVDYIYNTVKNLIQEDESNIPNKEALYGVIKYHFGKDYACKKLSIKKLDDQNLNTQIILENLLLQNDGKMSLQNIKQQLKWTDIMISSGINFNRNILYWDNYNYLLHSSKLNLPQNFREDLLIKIKNSMIDGYANSYMILKNAAVLLLKNGINDPVSVFSLSNHLLEDEFFFSRRPHILNSNTKQQFTTIQLILKMFLQKPIISYGELKHRMMNDFAFNEMSAGNYISKAQENLFQLDMDLYCLPDYVCLSPIDVEAVLCQLEIFLSNKKYIVLSEFDESKLCKNKLNIKDRTIDWNRYLINSIIKQNWNDSYRMIMKKNSDWRYDSTIIVPMLSEFNTLADIINHVIETEYHDKGNMILSKIEEFLVNKKIIFNKLPEEFFNSPKVTIDGFGRVNIAR